MKDNSCSADKLAHLAFQNNWPVFYNLVEDFPDFKIQAGLSEAEIASLEKNLDFNFPEDLKKFFEICSKLDMNGLSIRSDQLGVILLPESPALITGYLNLGSPADRLMMLPNDNSLYYLEQHNGAITRIASGFDAFFNEVLPRRLYG